MSRAKIKQRASCAPTCFASALHEASVTPLCALRNSAKRLVSEGKKKQADEAALTGQSEAEPGMAAQLAQPPIQHQAAAEKQADAKATWESMIQLQ